jgi:hypothetical protein
MVGERKAERLKPLLRGNIDCVLHDLAVSDMDAVKIA